ncbi:hypothetical protein D9M69_667890 [compost metagenome]
MGKGFLIAPMPGEPPTARLSVGAGHARDNRWHRRPVAGMARFHNIIACLLDPRVRGGRQCVGWITLHRSTTAAQAAPQWWMEERHPPYVSLIPYVQPLFQYTWVNL